MNAFRLSPALVAAAVAATLLAVVLLYWLHPPARRMFVSSNVIWAQVLEAYRRVTDRWRWWLSLLMAAAACVSIVLALVRPAAPDGNLEDRAIVVVDNAPTMAARTQTGVSRFALAQDKAVELIASFSAATEVMVVDTQRQITTPAFDSPFKAMELVKALTPGQSYQPIVPSAVAAVPAEYRYVVTDGVLLGQPPADYVVISVFEPVQNLGITAFDFDTVPGDPEKREAFVEVFNSSAQERTTEIVISGTGNQRVARKVSIAAGSSAGQVFDISMFGGGPIRAALTATGDGYSEDDVAYGYLSSRRLVRVTLVTDAANDYLGKSLRAQPRVRLSVMSPGRYLEQRGSDSARNTDVYVFDRFVPDALPATPALLIGSRSVKWLPPGGGAAKIPDIGAADYRHPVLRDISLRDLHIESGHYIGQPREASTTVLLSGGGGKALAVAHDGARRWVLLGFDVANSNFGLLPGFPVFLGNSINWLVDEPDIMRAQPGMVSVPFVDARIFAMDGSQVPAVVADGRSYFDAAKPGLYTAIANDRPLRITVNLLERRISDINRSALSMSDTPAPTALANDLPLGWSALLMLLALSLLCVEWVAYHRRITV